MNEVDYINQKSFFSLVSICVQTYQHEEYIGQCLDSLLSQKTDFDFEIILGEDGAQIVKEKSARHLLKNIPIKSDFSNEI